MKNHRKSKMYLREILILSLFFCAATSKNLDSSIGPLSDRFIELTNQKAKTWTAGRNFPAGTTMEDLKRRLGAFSDPESNLTTIFVHDIPKEFEDIENFDPRDKWPNCSSLHEIRDQGNCGSCWAVSPAAVMTDRSCIHSEGKINVHYSAQDITSCCFGCGAACNGGYVEKAFKFWKFWGVVTGGPYDSESGCRPYEVSNYYPSGDSPPCRMYCREGYEITYDEDKHYGKSIRRFSKNEEDIKYEIMMNGPVAATFYVYEDFYSYKSGVYQHREGYYLGKHAIKILGFGVENNIKYWLCANSWGPDWGDKGYFKILRGKNECNIEYDIATGLPFFKRNQ